MDLELSTEHRLLVDSLRAFVERELVPHEDEVERTAEVTPELAREIQDKSLAAGFYAPNMPAELGGGGLDGVGLALFEREMGRTCWGLRAYVFCPSNILLACEGDQRDTYLMPCITGERHDAIAFTEPGAGSDLLSMTTRAERSGDDWVINGRKHFISHADIADFVIVFAVTGMRETPRGPRKEITAFLVDKGTPGFESRRMGNAVSNRGYHQCELSFDDCRVGPGQVLGEIGTGMDLAGEWLYPGRLWVAASCVGRAERAFEMCLDWAATRKQFGQTIGRFQGVSFKLADMATEIRAADVMVLNAAWKIDQGTFTDLDAAMAKVFASEVAARVTDNAVQIFGGMGMMMEHPIQRFWRDSRVDRIWDGTSEVQRHIISRTLLRPREA